MPRYSKSASKDVERVMHERKRGTLKSGSGQKVKSRKQAIAIGLSEARREGKKVPPPPKKAASAKKSSTTRKAPARKAAATRRAPATRKTATRRK